MDKTQKIDIEWDNFSYVIGNFQLMSNARARLGKTMFFTLQNPGGVDEYCNVYPEHINYDLQSVNNVAY